MGRREPILSNRVPQLLQQDQLPRPKRGRLDGSAEEERKRARRSLLRRPRMKRSHIFRACLQHNIYILRVGYPLASRLQLHELTSTADIAISSFFSLHRPISVTTSFPPPTTTDSFNAIFEPRTQKSKIPDTIYTLASAVETIEASSKTAEERDLRFALQRRRPQAPRLRAEANQLRDASEAFPPLQRASAASPLP